MKQIKINTNLKIDFLYDDHYSENEILDLVFESIKGDVESTGTMMTDLGFYVKSKIEDRMEMKLCQIDITSHSITIKKDK